MNMNVISLILFVLIALLICYAVFRSVRRFRKGSACCGERDKDVKRINVKDKDRKHYPFLAEAGITGMTCSNCAATVENALNSLDGIWATVKLDSKMAIIRGKHPIEESLIREAVHYAGYGVSCYMPKQRDF